VNNMFTDDPLAPASAQFALARPGLAPPDDPARPSGSTTRPFGLRFAHPAPQLHIPAFSFSSELQMAVTGDGDRRPVIDVTPMMEWSTITHSDGDEGPSEDFGNDFCPDQTP